MTDPKKTIPWYKPHFWGKEREYADDALDSLWISAGPYIDKLEHWFRSALGIEHALAVSNGTTALHLIFLSLGLKEGDEIIVPGFGFLAAANIALQMKCKPVFAEVSPDTWCVDPFDAERKITSRTRAIVAVHSYGNVCRMKDLVELASRHKLVVIEDCAESLFSKLGGRYCGTFGDAGSFSFQATKTVTTGEGGLVVTGNTPWFETMKLYHSHGLKERGTYRHVLPGHNFRLTNIQAALGCAQVESMETIIAEKNSVVNLYRDRFAAESGFALQLTDSEVDPVWWVFALKLDTKAFPQGRDAVIGALRDKGIETRPGFVASSLLNLYDPHRLPKCEELSSSIISLPSYPTLPKEDILFICDQVLGLRR